jgi:hypothetical protein
VLRHEIPPRIGSCVETGDTTQDREEFRAHSPGEGSKQGRVEDGIS